VDVVDAHVEVVGELLVYLLGLGTQICHGSLTVSAWFSVGDIRRMVRYGI
jgi:hypothetical protein